MSQFNLVRIFKKVQGTNSFKCNDRNAIDVLFQMPNETLLIIGPSF